LIAEIAEFKTAVLAEIEAGISATSSDASSVPFANKEPIAEVATVLCLSPSTHSKGLDSEMKVELVV